VIVPDIMTSPAPGPAPASRKRQRSGIVVPNSPRWYQRLAAWLIYAFSRVVSASLRYHYQDNSGYFEGAPGGPTIYCAWHNRLALSLDVYFGYARRRKQSAGLAALVSASKDGAFLSAILECFGVQPVRGSSSRRGPQALLELTTWAERGYDLAITPDGPRGPCYVVQEGIIKLAQVTGIPILPASYRLGWKIRANSWDRFEIPLPFSRCDVSVGAPILVPREASDDDREALRLQLEKTLRSLSGD
jgi:lysophospholipid acyltransferase (LPLAT)-like uncharacterized protein